MEITEAANFANRLTQSVDRVCDGMGAQEGGLEGKLVRLFVQLLKQLAQMLAALAAGRLEPPAPGPAGATHGARGPDRPAWRLGWLMPRWAMSTPGSLPRERPTADAEMLEMPPVHGTSSRRREEPRRPSCGMAAEEEARKAAADAVARAEVLAPSSASRVARVPARLRVWDWMEVALWGPLGRPWRAQARPGNGQIFSKRSMRRVDCCVHFVAKSQ